MKSATREGIGRQTPEGCVGGIALFPELVKGTNGRRESGRNLMNKSSTGKTKGEVKRVSKYMTV